MINTINFDTLRPFEPRRYVLQECDLTQKDQVLQLYRNLLNEPISSQSDLKQWIYKRSEVEAAFHQAGSILYIKMTCQTDDPKRAEAYRAFIEDVVPVVEPLDDQLNKKFLEAAENFGLNERRFNVYTKAVKEDVSLFRKENVALSTKVSVLQQEYQTIIGKMTVEFNGREHTLPEMAKYQLDLDRDIRKRAWQASATRRLADQSQLDGIFDQMKELRHQIAVNAGEANYRDYKFRALHRFDYTPQDCRQYHQTVKEVVVPLWQRILAKRKDQLGVDPLRPWDLAVDVLARPALRPFATVDELTNKCGKIFFRVDTQLGEFFGQMTEGGLLDLASRKGKAPGGYQSSLDESRKPFIFMNAVGLDSDVRTLLHEAGHAFHTLACQDEPLIDYRHAPMEFNEVASMAMELLGGNFLSEFYTQQDFHRSRREHFEGIIFTLIWVATIDAFQHWLYENPQHTPGQRKEAWLNIYEEFNGGGMDWTGYEKQKEVIWHRQLHIFEVPFYYIEYAIAQLGALQVWRNSLEDFSGAVDKYKYALSLGGAKPLPDLYMSAGIRFDFSKETVLPLISAVEAELEKK